MNVTWLTFFSVFRVTVSMKLTGLRSRMMECVCSCTPSQMEECVSVLSSESCSGWKLPFMLAWVTVAMPLSLMMHSWSVL